MSAKKKMTAKQKAAKRTPRTWVRWAVLEGSGRFCTVVRTRSDAIYIGNPGDEYIRVRITEIVR